MKRFYEQVDIFQNELCYQITLDNKFLKTPLKSMLQLPTKRLAKKIAEEWSNIETDIMPELMPLFSLAVTAIDRVATQKNELSFEMQKFIMNDLLCYRESEDVKLQEQQTKYWDPWLNWAKTEFKFDLRLAKGVMPISQKDNNMNLLMQIISKMDIWTFMCFVKATKLTGSAILALAFVRKQIEPDELFFLSYLDELYQIGRWGEDDESIGKHVSVKNELHDLSEFFRLAEL